VTTEQRKLRELERALQQMPGVKSAHVAGDEQPTEIHIVTTSTQPVKRIVRDVESLALASFNVKIDYRIVSVVRVEGPESSAPVTSPRPWVERVAVASKDNAEWVEVALRWPDGTQTSGTGAAGYTREGRARGATAAVIECLDKRLGSAGMMVEVDQVVIQRLSAAEWVLVHAQLYEQGSALPLVGTAQLKDDVASAAVRALLDAVNRKLPA
jgi:hypothetical protein